MACKILIAKTAGFCFGVHRALEKALQTVRSTDDSIRTYGPLIHNEQVLDLLRLRGVEELSSGENIHNKNVVVRAHGISPNARKNLKEQGALICDATCPKVAQVQSIVKKYAGQGYSIIIIGDAGHAEVEGLLGYCQGQGIVIAGPEQASRFDFPEKVCIVAQTTQSREVFEKTSAIIESKSRQIKIFDTICNATSDRQAETIRIARRSDVMIVIGGKNSANTHRLVSIAQKECRTIWIQGPDDIHAEMLQDARRIGITAGASTPAWLIRHVVEKLRTICSENLNSVAKYLHRTFDYMLYLRLFLAISAGLVSIGFMNITGVNIRLIDAFLAVWVMWSWTVLYDQGSNNTFIYQRIMANQLVIKQYGLLVTFVIITGIVPMMAAVFSDFRHIMTLICVYLLIYLNVKLQGKSLALNTQGTTNNLYYFLKDVLHAGTAALSIVIYPALSLGNYTYGIFFAVIFIFCLTWMYGVAKDVRNMQMDLIGGRPSLPGQLSDFSFRILIMAVLFFWTLATFVFIVITPVPTAYL
ncbi:4-hydroxy-3-methylbut-2-enyl diphosphate reductase, partial [bacterium]|nr:4-hydroxy-3-methylbut-2-enyl diphosphate reductase [candidate division CSSED10-310 bacterium]